MLIECAVPDGATVRAAIEASGILSRCPEIDISQQAVGVYGRLKALEDPLHPEDRVEIYRPLRNDPKESRRRRAAHRARSK